jgi:hypothetical protein
MWPHSFLLFKWLPLVQSSHTVTEPVDCRFTRWILHFLPPFSQPLLVPEQVARDRSCYIWKLDLISTARGWSSCTVACHFIPIFRPNSNEFNSNWRLRSRSASLIVLQRAEMFPTCSRIQGAKNGWQVIWMCGVTENYIWHSECAVNQNTKYINTQYLINCALNLGCHRQRAYNCDHPSERTYI